MSEMIERVAKAISMNVYGGYEAYAENRAASPQWKNAMTTARAAIEAMREPTGAMSSAGSSFSWDIDEGQATCIWRDMIDAALSESGSPAMSPSG